MPGGHALQHDGRRLVLQEIEHHSLPGIVADYGGAVQIGPVRLGHGPIVSAQLPRERTDQYQNGCRSPAADARAVPKVEAADQQHTAGIDPGPPFQAVLKRSYLPPYRSSTKKISESASSAIHRTQSPTVNRDFSPQSSCNGE